MAHFSRTLADSPATNQYPLSPCGRGQGEGDQWNRLRDSFTALVPLAARGGLLSCRDQESNQRAPPVAARLFEPVPCAPRLSRALRNSPNQKTDSGSNSARALLRLKRWCSRAPRGRQQQRQHRRNHFVHCALLEPSLLVYLYTNHGNASRSLDILQPRAFMQRLSGL